MCSNNPDIEMKTSSITKEKLIFEITSILPFSEGQTQCSFNFKLDHFNI